MAEKVLSVFIDESGDFDPYDFHAPSYLVAMFLNHHHGYHTGWLSLGIFAE